MVQKERRDTRAGLAVDYRPVDRRRAAVLRQQRSMQVERTQPRHAPYDLGQHAEGYDDAQIGFERFERFDELRCAQLLGLQDRQTELFGRDLNVALVYLCPRPAGLSGVVTTATML